MRRLEQIMNELFSLGYNFDYLPSQDICGLPRLCTGVSFPSVHAGQVYLVYYLRIKKMPK